MSLQPGTRLGVYEIQSALGAGGMGEVYRARDSKLGRDVAIKVLPEAVVSDPERVARFEREAQLLAAINHPYIAGVYGLEEAASQHFLAMELIEGESLADRLRGGALPLDEALSVARQIGEALAAAHEKGIIHRDLKPANVMLTRDGSVKVLDFGLAKIVDSPSAASSSVSMSPTLSLQTTMAGTILGSAAYMSPEQAHQQSDIWVWDLIGQTLTRLTLDPALDTFPVWEPTGKRIAYNRQSEGLFIRPANGTGEESLLSKSDLIQFAQSFTPDGKSLVITQQKAANDLALITTDGTGKTTPLVETSFIEGLAEISPDGRWLAYQSDESGQDQIYVRPFPNVNDSRLQVSRDGGSKPVWSPRGGELFYLDGKSALTAVPVTTGAVFGVGTPKTLFDARYFSANQARSYDVTRDAQRFLFIKDTALEAADPNTTPASIIVTLNWFSELKKQR